MIHKMRMTVAELKHTSPSRILGQLRKEIHYCYFEKEADLLTIGIGELFDNEAMYDSRLFEQRQSDRIQAELELPKQISMIPFDLANNSYLKKEVKHPIHTISPEIVIDFDRKNNGVSCFVYSSNPQITDSTTDYYQAYKRRIIRYCKTHQVHDQHPDRLHFQFESDKDTYSMAFDQAKQAIQQGDVFQLVLSNTLRASGNCDLTLVFDYLLSENASPYLLLFHLIEDSYLSASPEILVEKKGSTLMTVPIAGTCPRLYDGLDESRAKELLSSQKERAEHLMLVDLGRNDLGRISKPGSVKVSSYAQLKKLSKVMHIASTVQGMQLEGGSYFEPLFTTLPAGTVSGAPKKMALYLIDKIEASERKHYAGSFVIEDSKGDYTSLITIRTLHQTRHEVNIRVGSGIVNDSTLEGERDELVHKAMGLISALEHTHRGGISHDFSD
ncbi:MULTISPECIES: anthranilate synthase component I family protein [unclassified Fusibacter]|uniref:chorismate-binding protein n=1 Tax=unclassified Fusibacter TaxID=2624464 RepID=UPI0013E93EEB|nr:MULTISPECIES: anthranilate synthase component I family protein [unclassified Fusibacter]MCK8061414.1 anthranilate synthase component I family protein [Fusibacter sp. A2]NPE23543.1 anthranilate synthase component I family protein [Fusibacter sp. A1]